MSGGLENMHLENVCRLCLTDASEAGDMFPIFPVRGGNPHSPTSVVNRILQCTSLRKFSREASSGSRSIRDRQLQVDSNGSVGYDGAATESSYPILIREEIHRYGRGKYARVAMPSILHGRDREKIPFAVDC
uniref:Uncharacterized protein n=1 Tax=Anopheles culicifacies TaxID=139723 RepID=A0A182M7V4_9DIPT